MPKGLGRGYFFPKRDRIAIVPEEPAIKRTFAFVDGQNLFHAVKEAFGYRLPNYDVLKLAELVCSRQNWNLLKTGFYTGIPDPTDNPFWSHFWSAKFANMGRKGIEVFSRPLRYRNKSITLPDGSTYSTLVGREKGVDVRIALDVVHAVRANLCDVVLVFSQDQDFSEVAKEVRQISRQQSRWIKIATAFPDSPVCKNHRGVSGTDWIKISKADYDSCIDPRDYRPGKSEKKTI